MARDTKQIELDRMRYTKNKLSANLVLLAIVLDALYFVSLYRLDVGSYYYNMLVGASIIYNLVFMLAAFLCSEGVKSRKGNFAPMLAVLGVGQIVRIFIIPQQAHTTMQKGIELPYLSDGGYWFMIICLALSAACLLGAAVTSYQQNKRLNDYLKTLKPVPYKS